MVLIISSFWGSGFLHFGCLKNCGAENKVNFEHLVVCFRCLFSLRFLSNRAELFYLKFKLFFLEVEFAFLGSDCKLSRDEVFYFTFMGNSWSLEPVPGFSLCLHLIAWKKVEKKRKLNLEYYGSCCCLFVFYFSDSTPQNYSFKILVSFLLFSFFFTK